MNTEKLIAIIHKIAEKIEAEKDYLTELDCPIGDSDHGINLARGFKEVEKKIIVEENVMNMMKRIH